MSTQPRPIFSTYERGKVKISYFATVSDEIECAHKYYGCLCPCSCMWYEPLSKALRESTYVQVLENRIEYNYPYSMITCSFPDIWRVNCHVIDHTGVIYFDRAVTQHAEVAECCSPCLTHNQCCPSCCGLFGETVVLYENVPGMGACCGGACNNLCTCCHVFNVGVNAPGIVSRHCCAAQHLMLPCVKDAKDLAEAINKTRDERLKNQHIEVEMEMSR